MKKIVTLSVGLMLLASVAMAQVSLNLDDCSVGTANHAVTNTCTSNLGTAFTAHCSIVMPAVTRVGFVGAQAVLDVMSSDATLPDWWRADACRSAGFLVAADAGIVVDCPSLWDTHPGAGANLTALYGTHGQNWERFLLGQVLASTDVYDLTGDGTTEIDVFTLKAQRSFTLGTPSCGGCLSGACMVLNEINLQTLTDTPATFLRLTGALPGASDFINYNSFSGAVCPDAVPVRNRTWGSIKALYR